MLWRWRILASERRCLEFVSDPLLAQQVGILPGKGAARLAGLEIPNLSAHSLRHGFATAVAKANVREKALQQHGRWKDPKSVSECIQLVRGYEDAINHLVGL